MSVEGLYTRLVNLLDCVLIELADADLPIPGKVMVNPGEVVWDACCEGMLWDSLTAIGPSNSFPNFEIAPAPCRYPFAAQVQLGIIRCSTGLEALDDGYAIEAPALSYDSLVQIEDMWAMQKAVDCCGKGTYLATWTPLGPEGGCVGGAWTVWFDEVVRGDDSLTMEPPQFVLDPNR